jgi:DNA polymerase III epsilon subunit family exonuclease
MGLFDKLKKSAERVIMGGVQEKPSMAESSLFDPDPQPYHPPAPAPQPTPQPSQQRNSVFKTNNVEQELGLTFKARSMKLHKLPNSYVAMDLETTGFNSVSDGIVEIGAVKVIDGLMVETFETFVDTDAKMNPEARKVNGITRDMLKGAPKTDEAMRAFIAFADGMPLLGHNAIDFDRGFIEHACVRIPDLAVDNEWFDTMKLARDIYGGKVSLEALCERHGIVNDSAHRALSDSMATHECYQAMRSDIARVTTDARDFPEPAATGPLVGEVICITGECPTMCRHDLMQLIIENGGTLANSVTKKVTILVDFEGRESGKVKKARELESSTGVKIIHGQELFARIGR